MPRGFRFMAAAVLLAAASSAAPAGAEPRDHDQVRQAVARGEIRPLADILGAVRGKLPGEITGVEIEQKSGRWLYEFRVVDRAGRLFEVYVDAGTGEIERIKEK
jgi:uncharacterized membrane protein YkoI